VLEAKWRDICINAYCLFVCQEWAIRKTFLFDKEIACDMLRFKVSLPTIILTFVLFTGIINVMSIKLTYGIAGSLEELRNELTNETGYTNELVGYIKLHNITMAYEPELMAKVVGIEKLEEMVKTHMEFCQGKPSGEIGGDPFYENFWTSNGNC
jgi:hypothetical protein